MHRDPCCGGSPATGTWACQEDATISQESLISADIQTKDSHKPLAWPGPMKKGALFQS